MSPRRLAAGAALVAGSAAALWVLWGSVVLHFFDGGSLEYCLKNYYAADQYSVLGLARNTQDGFSAYSDPYAASWTSLYPAEYYRLLGLAAEATHTTVIWSWNVVGLVVSCLLIALSVVWALRLAPGSSAWVFAPLPFLVGSLYWWVSGAWGYTSGAAVLWPPFASLYSPGAEPPAFLLAGISLLAVAGALAAGGRPRFVWAVVAGAAAGLTLQVHANIAVFCVVATAMVTLADDLITFATSRRRRIVGGGAAVMLAATLAVPKSGVLPRLGLLLGALFLVLITDARWRQGRGLIAAAYIAAAVIFSMPLSARLAAEIISGEGYFYQREQTTGLADVDLPVHDVLLLWLPVWLLIGGVAWWLARHRDDDVHPGWLPLLAGLAGATLLLTFAGRLGTNGLEWHRFLIGGVFLATMAAAPGLWLMLRDTADRRQWAIGVGLTVVLAATAPTAGAFAADQRDAILCTPPQEADAFERIGQAAGRNRIVLLDRCFAQGPFRIVSGTRTLFANFGIAAPPDREALVAILNDVSAGTLPPDAELRELGVTSFLTNTQCAGVSPEVLARRYGAPILKLPLRNGEALGLPPGLTYELYDLPATSEVPRRHEHASMASIGSGWKVPRERG